MPSDGSPLMDGSRDVPCPECKGAREVLVKDDDTQEEFMDTCMRCHGSSEVPKDERGNPILGDACRECGAPWGYPPAGPCLSCAPLALRTPRARDEMYMHFLKDLRRERDKADAEVARLRGIVGGLYESRKLGGSELRRAIRLAFGEARPR